MSTEKKKQASFKSTMELSQAVKYLDDVAKSLRGGTLTITNSEKQVTLTPENLVRLGLDATHKVDRESLKIEISWRKDAVADEDVHLTISPHAPEPKEEEASHADDSAAKSAASSGKSRSKGKSR